MAKPIIKQMTPFDASEGTMVYFSWNGFMAYNNRMIIYDADTMRVVYDHVYSQPCYTLNHEIPGEILSNGKKYAVSIAVIGEDGAQSDLSDKYFFWVSQTPTFYLKGLAYDEPLLVEDSSYIAELVYSQSNGVAIDTYQFFLYNSVHELIDTSDVFKGSNSSFKYTYRPLDGNSVYYLRATGVTTQGVTMDTRITDGEDYKDYEIDVKYEEPSMYAYFYADPNPIIGTVDYYTNVIVIESDLPSNRYAFEDGFIDLTKAPYSVRYSDNLTIPRDMTVSLRMRNIYRSCDILKGQTENIDQWLLQSVYDEDAHELRFKLTAYGETTDCIVYSDPLTYTAYDIITLHLRRSNGIYGLYAFVTHVDVDIVEDQWFYSFRGNKQYAFNGETKSEHSIFVSIPEDIDYVFIDDNSRAREERAAAFEEQSISNDEYVFTSADGVGVGEQLIHKKTQLVK